MPTSRKAILLVVLLVVAVAIVWAASRTAVRDRSLPALVAGDYEGSLVFEGRERYYLLHIPPSYDSRTPSALVIVLHGGGGNPEHAADMTGFNAKADSEGFIVVYPAGTGQLKDRLLTWNTWNCCGYALDNNVNDVGFINALIDKLENTVSIDEARIFVTGISNGGMMSYRLGCELADRIAAIAPVAGALNTDSCKPSQPASVVVFHGTADRHVLYEGGEPLAQFDPHRRVDNSVEYAVSFWVNNDECSLIPETTEQGNIRVDKYPGCAMGTEVVLYTIKDGRHAWPGGQKMSIVGDEPTEEISATDIMWDFFATHPKQLTLESASVFDSFGAACSAATLTYVSRASPLLEARVYGIHSDRARSCCHA
jgi:polyhydroxybutyrate depolymerase